MEPKGIFISFVGSRGSGKTTVANLVCAHLQKRGYSCLRQHPGLSKHDLLRGIATAIYLWRFFDFSMMNYFGFRGRSTRRRPSLYRLYLPLALAHDLHHLATGRSNFLVYDSNILRGIISSVARGTTTKAEIHDLYKKKVLSSAKKLLFIVVDTDPAIAVDRWIARDKVSLSVDEYQAAIAERIKIMNETNVVITMLSELPQVTVVHLDGSVSAEENATRVVAAIS